MRRRQRRTTKATRRSFLRGAALVGAAAIAMPQVSRAQTTIWKYQSTWPMKDIFHDCAVDYAKKVNDMTVGRLTAPSFGWDSHGLLGWFYQGGGEALYNELVNEILKVNTVGFLYFPMPTQPLGWFKSAVTGPDDLRKIK